MIKRFLRLFKDYRMAVDDASYWEAEYDAMLASYITIQDDNEALQNKLSRKGRAGRKPKPEFVVLSGNDCEGSN